MSHQRGATAEDEARLGQHIVSVAEDAGTQLDLLAPVFRAGLASECQCLFIADRTPPPALVTALSERGCDIATHLETGQFVVATADRTYLRDGRFEPDQMVGVVADAIAEARKAGFRGLCASGELSWLGRGAPGSERVLEYEFRLNYLDEPQAAAIICLYDKNTIPIWVGRELESIHPLTHQNGQVAPSETYAADSAYAAQLPLAQELEPPADSLPCPWLAELVSAHADGELIPRRGQELATHVTGCPVCRAWTGAVRELKQAMSALRTATPVPDGFWAAARSRMRSPQGSE